ncbi:MAG: PaaI family thioesterase [Deferrisomatales bacterium]|nr:PaaI family thioesterase [Deferrisomatales bacterium]
MSRRDQLETFFNDGAPIAKTFGMRLHFDEEDRAVVVLPYNPGLDHALQGTHGGVYMTLLDTAAWFTSAVRHDGQCWITTSEMSVHFLKPAARTELRAVGYPMQSGKRQDIVEAKVFDQQGQLCGHGVGTFMVLPSVPMKT